MSHIQPTPDSPADESPIKKVWRPEGATDAPSLMNPARTFQERHTPDTRKRPGQGAPHREAPSASSDDDPFLAPVQPGSAPAQVGPEGLVLQRPRHNHDWRDGQRTARNHDSTLSPTNGKSSGPGHSLDVGRAGTDIDSLEDGEIDERSQRSESPVDHDADTPVAGELTQANNGDDIAIVHPAPVVPAAANAATQASANTTTVPVDTAAIAHAPEHAPAQAVVGAAGTIDAAVADAPNAGMQAAGTAIAKNAHPAEAGDAHPANAEAPANIAAAAPTGANTNGGDIQMIDAPIADNGAIPPNHGPPFRFGQPQAAQFAPDLQLGAQRVAIQAAADYPGFQPQVFLMGDAQAPLHNPAAYLAAQQAVQIPPAAQDPQGGPPPQAPHVAMARMDIDDNGQQQADDQGAQPGPAANDAEEPHHPDSYPTFYPTRAQLTAEPPTAVAQNPHVNVPAEPVHQPAGPADLTARPIRQPNEGNFRRAITALHKYLENADPAVAAKILARPGDWVLLPIFNGGPSAFAKLSKSGDIGERILAAVAGEAGEGEIEIVSLGRADPKYKLGPDTPGTYQPPYAFAALVTPAAKARMRAVGTYGVDEDFAFHVAEADPLVFPWVVTMLKVQTMKLGMTMEDKARILRSELIDTIIQTHALRIVIDRASSPHDRRHLDVRILDFVRSIDPRWDPLMKAFTVYMQPCTPDARAWDTVVAAISALELKGDDAHFHPILVTDKVNLGPRCVLCKLECHLIQGCPFIHSGMIWWGPKDQIKNLTTGILAARGRGAPHATRARGNSRGRGGNGQARGRGG
ncbi:hypothetical protein C8R43DRAFT_608332 [Mycena crocata]|nr:hypothetical protein C8R43DRAFT_608332 [Mycena crocata]